MNLYTDTRGIVTEPLTFSEVVLKGIAPGGGLFVPEHIPTMTLDEICGLAKLPYWQRASNIYQRFEVDFTRDETERLMQLAYGDNFDTPDIAPVKSIGDGMYALELWHGPTSAFKDMALQCLPVFFSASVEKQRAGGTSGADGTSGAAGPDGSSSSDGASGSTADVNYLIAVATSGDTGKAALEGFRDREHTSIIVFYPDGGVSDIQHKQMATQGGSNVRVHGVRGNFDDCQGAVKRMFVDDDFNERLANTSGTRLSSANSINWGRLLPQIVYYVSSYASMVAAGHITAGEAIDVTVPSGNFGNITACWYAKKMGVPIERIVCASNANHVLTDFIDTGIYDITDREFVLTISPSMDILVSSNLERQLFELTGRDTERIAGWWRELADRKRFQVDARTFGRLRQHYACGMVDNDTSLQTIRSVWERYAYVIDPHTAVAWTVAERNKSERAMLVASTANWAKFGSAVYRALHDLSSTDPLPSSVAGLTGVEMNRLVSKETGGTPIPAALDELDEAEVRFTEVIGNTLGDVEAAVERFVG